MLYIPHSSGEPKWRWRCARERMLDRTPGLDLGNRSAHVD
jgi:hypothetical protein